MVFRQASKSLTKGLIMRYLLTICLLLLAGCSSSLTEHPRKPQTTLSYNQWRVVNMLIDPNVFEVPEDSIDVQLGLRRYSGTRIAIR